MPFPPKHLNVTSFIALKPHRPETFTLCSMTPLFTYPPHYRRQKQITAAKRGWSNVYIKNTYLQIAHVMARSLQNILYIMMDIQEKSVHKKERKNSPSSHHVTTNHQVSPVRCVNQIN